MTNGGMIPRWSGRGGGVSRQSYLKTAAKHIAFYDRSNVSRDFEERSNVRTTQATKIPATENRTGVV